MYALDLFNLYNVSSQANNALSGILKIEHQSTVIYNSVIQYAKIFELAFKS